MASGNAWISSLVLILTHPSRQPDQRQRDYGTIITIHCCLDFFCLSPGQATPGGPLIMSERDWHVRASWYLSIYLTPSILLKCDLPFQSADFPLRPFHKGKIDRQVIKERMTRGTSSRSKTRIKQVKCGRHNSIRYCNSSEIQ